MDLVSQLDAPNVDKEKFRVYCNEAGWTNAISTILTTMWAADPKEYPEEGAEWIKTILGAPTKVEVKEMKEENDELHRQVARLEKELAEVKAKLPEPAATE